MKFGRWLVRGFLVVIVIIVGGCVEGETELVLKPDGQGSVRNVVRLGDLASVLMRMGELESRPGSGADVGLCEMLEKTEEGLELDVVYQLPEGADRHATCVRIARVEVWSEGSA